MGPYDTNAFFHHSALGGNSAVSGIATLLGAAEALSRVENVTRLPRKILLALFQGEAYSFVGSRRFVTDIRNFTCHEVCSPSTTVHNWQLI